jgi:regulator of protease activity HflC (stomatin/prohibitin superfamily)
MDPKVKTYIKLGVLGVLALVVVLGAIDGFYTIEQGEVGVVLTMGKASPEPSQPGFHLKIPFVQRVVDMNVRTQKREAKANAASKDIQEVHSSLTINFSLNPASAPKVYGKLGMDYVGVVIDPAVQDVFKAVTAQFTATELITKRAEAKQKIENQLKKRFKDSGILMTDANLTDFEFTNTFKAAIEAKVTAEQKALKAEWKLKEAKVKKQETITNAEAKADSLKRQSDAEAYSVGVKAKAEANALRLVGEQLKKNPDLIKLRWVDKWDGVRPRTVLGNGTTPLVSINK